MLQTQSSTLLIEKKKKTCGWLIYYYQLGTNYTKTSMIQNHTLNYKEKWNSIAAHSCWNLKSLKHWAWDPETQYKSMQSSAIMTDGHWGNMAQIITPKKNPSEDSSIYTATPCALERNNLTSVEQCTHRSNSFKNSLSGRFGSLGFPFLHGGTFEHIPHAPSFLLEELGILGTFLSPGWVERCCVLIHKMSVFGSSWAAKVLDLKTKRRTN